MSFTASQKLAIEVMDRDLLISAGAGAGKTHTLIERLALLMTAPDGCSIDELLVVTFTRAAAQEMKTRLQKRLAQELAATDPADPRSSYLQEQILALPRARISTIHSFCLQIIGEHPGVVGLSPGFGLMSEGETQLFHREFVEAEINRLLESSSEVKALMRKLLTTRKPQSAFETLVGWVLEFHAFLESLPNPATWVSKWASGTAPSVRQAPYRKLWQNRLRLQLGRLLIELSWVGGVERERLAPRMIEQHDFLQRIAEAVRQQLKNDGDVDPAALTSLANLPRLATTKVTPPDEEYDRWFRENREKASKKIRETIGALQTLVDEAAVDAALEFDDAMAGVFARELGPPLLDRLLERHLEERRLTFSQLERLALRILTDEEGQPTGIAQSYRQSIRHVLVDEFQDVNELQERILRAVSRPASSDTAGNFFAVGDIKQSIYEFRQADPSLFLDLYNRSIPCDQSEDNEQPGRITLAHNFRSHPMLLSGFNSLFSRLMQVGTQGIDYEAEHQLIAGRLPGGDARPFGFTIDVLQVEAEMEMTWEEYYSAEAAWVAQEVLRLGPPWKDICILTRSAQGRVPHLLEALAEAGVPVYTNHRSSFLEAIEVLEFRSILSCIDNPFRDVELLGMLRGPAFRWSESELLELRLIDRQAYFHSNLLAAAIDPGSSIHSRASEVINAIKRWQDLSSHLNMEELFVHLYDELDLLEIAAVRPGGDQRRRNLEALLDRAREFDGFLRKGLSRFLRFLDDLIEEGRDFAAPSTIPENADVVRIMTIHASKGMEFPIVILPWIGAAFNQSSRRRAILWDRNCGISSRLEALDEEDEEGRETNLLHELIQQERARKETCEELRLLYVALTRARESVHLIGSFKERHLRALFEQGAAGENAAEVILGGRCYGDWVIPWAIELAGGSPEPGSSIAFGPATLRFVAERELCDGLASARRVGRELERLRSIQPVTREDWAELLAGEGSAPSEDKAMERPIDPALVEEFSKAAARIAELQRQPPNPLLRAKISVTEAKRAYEAHRDDSTPAYLVREGAGAAGPPEWVPPGFGGKPPVALETGPQLGTITHRFLANLDLAPLGQQIRLKAEVTRQVDEGLLSPEEAAALRLADIAWFFGTTAGAEFLQQMGRVHRERPFTAKVEGGRLHPLAAGRPVILQGILDVLYRRSDGWVILDYKTDHIRSPEHLAELRRAYSIQMVLYKLLVETTLGEPVVAGRLAFLRAQQVIDVAWDGVAVPWEEILQASAVLFPESNTIDPSIKWL